MTNHIQSFIDDMRSKGCGPERESDIRADDVKHSYRVEGDKPGKKSGSYCLRIDGDFAVGWYRSHKEGITHSWNCKSDRKWTDEEKAAWKERVEADRKLRQKQIEDEQAKAAIDAKAIWDSAVPAKDHPYLAKKQIIPFIAREYEGELLIPMFADDKFWAYQKITPEGDKWYIGGARKQGCYCPLAGPADDRSVLVLCEGFATGASIRMATGLPVIVCFDAGNLDPVGRAIRVKYPEANMVIATDDDLWTKKPDGTAWNPGREKAEQLAVRIKARVIGPGFDVSHLDKPSDFNDLHVISGLDAVKNRIQQAVISPPVDAAREQQAPLDVPFSGGEPLMLENQSGWVPDEYPADDWRSKFIVKYNNKGEARPDPDKSWNYCVLLEGHAANVFAYDEFQLCIMVVKPAPWEDAETFKVHELNDHDIRYCDYFLQKYGMNGSLEKTMGAIAASADKNRVHPARDYFNSLEWDGVPRLDRWLTYYLGCEVDDKEYLAAAGSKWMIAAVNRVFEPGCKFDHMLLLEGRQGSYKSSALRVLSTFGDEGLEQEYFTDGFRIANLKDKDELMKLSGCLIIEIGEMADFSKVDINLLKNFITIQYDKYRTPYGRTTQSYARQFVFAGSRNPVGGIFHDPTGARRFWPAATGKIDIAALRKDKKQLWAEAVHRYKKGESLALSEELYSKCEEAAQARKVIDDWTQDVLDAVGLRDFITVREIQVAMGIPIYSRSQNESKRISNILKSEGYDYKQRRVGSKRVWGWEKPGANQNLPLEDVDHG